MTLHTDSNITWDIPTPGPCIYDSGGVPKFDARFGREVAPKTYWAIPEMSETPKVELMAALEQRVALYEQGIADDWTRPDLDGGSRLEPVYSRRAWSIPCFPVKPTSDEVKKWIERFHAKEGHDPFTVVVCGSDEGRHGDPPGYGILMIGGG